MGQLLTRSLDNSDLPVILGIVLVVSVAVVVANLVVDILYSVLDPRIRLHGPSRLGEGLAPRSCVSCARSRSSSRRRARVAYVSHSAHACS